TDRRSSVKHARKSRAAALLAWAYSRPRHQSIASASQIDVRVIERDGSPARRPSAAAQVDSLAIALFEAQLDVDSSRCMVGLDYDVIRRDRLEQAGPVELLEAELPQRLIEDIAWRERDHSKDHKCFRARVAGDC